MARTVWIGIEKETDLVSSKLEIDEECRGTIGFVVHWIGGTQLRLAHYIEVRVPDNVEFSLQGRREVTLGL